MSELQDLVALIRAETPLLVIETPDESRVIALFRQSLTHAWRALHRWSVTEGLRRLDIDREDESEGAPDLSATLQAIRSATQRGTYLLLDAHPYLGYASYQRALRDVIQRRDCQPHVLVMIGTRDELLDRRVAGGLPDREAMQAQCAAALREGDAEASLHALNEVRQALSFRIALALLDARCDAQSCAQRLAWLADAVVACVLRIAMGEMRAAHGVVPAGRFAVLGYGSLGGEELGFGSDLDLVFLYDSADDAQSDGARPLDAPRWFARLGQKIVALLGVGTGAGRLFEVDVRLRPDGAKGLLVSSLASFCDYQRERAWTWEHQALVRARAVAGDAELVADFDALRAQVLARPRDPASLAEDVSSMRRRMRAELDRSDAAVFDLKQGEGGLVDLEFLLQHLVLRDAAVHASLHGPRATPALLDAVLATGSITPETHASLLAAHASLLDAGMRCTLDRRPRRVPPDAAIEAARAAIRAAISAQGLGETGSG